MNAIKFNSLGLAMQFVDNTEKSMWIVLGDDGKFWAVRPVDAAKLEKQGYEIL